MKIEEKDEGRKEKTEEEKDGGPRINLGEGMGL